MSAKLVTILIPNFKTPEITKICMRLIRQNTDFNQVEVIVIDNNSADSSTEYLRTLTWIKLIERQPPPEEPGPLAHSRALDLALEKVKTPYVLSIHTDTFVKRADWIDILLAPFKYDTNVAGVGSWKLESKSSLQIFGYRFENAWKYTMALFTDYKGYNPDRLNVKARYLRSHCAMYRTDIIKAVHTSFSDGEHTAGKIMHKKIVDAGYKMLFLPTEELGQYVDHINHATMILNPQPHSRKKLFIAGNKRIKKIFRGIDANSILDNDALDK